MNLSGGTSAQKRSSGFTVTRPPPTPCAFARTRPTSPWSRAARARWSPRTGAAAVRSTPSSGPQPSWPVRPASSVETRAAAQIHARDWLAPQMESCTPPRWATSRETSPPFPRVSAEEPPSKWKTPSTGFEVPRGAASGPRWPARRTLRRPAFLRLFQIRPSWAPPTSGRACPGATRRATTIRFTSSSARRERSWTSLATRWCRASLACAG